jgi:hypothetical protein
MRDLGRDVVALLLVIALMAVVPLALAFRSKSLAGLAFVVLAVWFLYAFWLVRKRDSQGE